MKLFEIILPHVDNSGSSYHHAHEEVRKHLLARYGGYTVCQVAGEWRDPADGTVYMDASAAYRILADAEPERDGNLAIIFALLPDQLAICVNEIGSGRIVQR